MNRLRNFVINLNSVQAVLRAAAMCPPGYRRGIDRLWLDEPSATVFACRLARWSGLVKWVDMGTLRKSWGIMLTDAGRDAIKPRAQ